MYASIQFTKTTSSRNKETNARSRTLLLLTVITVFVAVAIPVQLSAQTPSTTRLMSRARSAPTLKALTQRG